MIEFLTDYAILERGDIAYQIFIGIKEIENILLYEPSSVHLCHACNQPIGYQPGDETFTCMHCQSGPKKAIGHLGTYELIKSRISNPVSVLKPIPMDNNAVEIS